MKGEYLLTKLYINEELSKQRYKNLDSRNRCPANGATVLKFGPVTDACLMKHVLWRTFQYNCGLINFEILQAN